MENSQSEKSGKYPYANVDEYIAQCPEASRAQLQALRLAIREAAPGVQETISYGMPAFKMHRVLVYFALTQKHIGFFPTNSGIEAFAGRLNGYSISKGTIRLPLDQPLPLPLIREITAFRAEEDRRLEEQKAAALESLPNMGKVLAANLRAVGVETPDALRALGAKDAFLRIRAAVDPGACLQMLYGLQGAVAGVRDTLLDAQTKADLRSFFKTLGP